MYLPTISDTVSICGLQSLVLYNYALSDLNQPNNTTNGWVVTPTDPSVEKTYLFQVQATDVLGQTLESSVFTLHVGCTISAESSIDVDYTGL